MIKVENRIPFAELGNKIGTDRDAYMAHMEQEFYVQDPVHDDHEKVITRSDFEDAMAPMQCWFLSDNAMERIAKQVTEALKTYPKDNVSDENDLDDALCMEEENALRAFGVCYYEDEIPPVSKEGARLFSLDHGYGTFNGMVEKYGEEMVEMTTDDGKIITTWPGLVVEEY
jgi:hypothetical protein